MKKFSLLAAALSVAALSLQAQVIVNPLQIKGDIKLMNAVNNGPAAPTGDQSNDNFDAYKDCAIPYARTHDSSFDAHYGAEHTIDISGIFPDFSKDVDKPESYDFAMTDGYVKLIQAAGTKVYYRLGQRIEHAPKKYNILPPKDYLKWARICEHIIRHYTEGWNNGYRYDIQYWEIWNEPDLGSRDGSWKTNPKTWGGSKEEFFKFYQTAANHLNKCFPQLKIGGPAIAGDETWGDEFLAYMQEHKVDLDFFSWHIYSTQPRDIAAKAGRIRTMMDKHGYEKSESILNEWNYVKGWSKDFQYSIRTINSLKGAAFVAATFDACQDKPVDMLMYYDARVSTTFNGMFNLYDHSPSTPYYPFYAWKKMLQLGKQAEVSIAGDAKDLYAVAATNGQGRTGIFLARYNDDNNVVANQKYEVKVNGLTADNEVVGHLTDTYHIFTEVPLTAKDGAIQVRMEPNSFIYIEIR